MSVTAANAISASATEARWPDSPGRARALPSRLAEAIRGIGPNARILLADASDKAWFSLLGNLTLDSEIVTMAADPPEGGIERARGGGSDWDLILDASTSTNHRRIELLLTLLPRLKPNGLYLLIDPTAAMRGGEAGQGGELLRLLHTLSDMINDTASPAAGHPAASSPQFKAENTVLPRAPHSVVKALVGSIEIVSSGAILRRAAPSLDAPQNLDLSFGDLQLYFGPSNVDGQCAQMRIAALSAELERLTLLSARQAADIAALEKERNRLANRGWLRLATLGGNVGGAPRSMKQKAIRLALAMLRRALAIPRVRTLARKLGRQFLR